MSADGDDPLGLVSLDGSLSQLHSVMGPFDIYGATGVDPLLRSRRELVCQLFQMVNHPSNLELSVAALRVIDDISDSPHFAAANPYAAHKIYTILEMAGMLEQVMDAFVQRLEREESEEPVGLAGQADCPDAIARFGLTNLVRLQILEYLIKNVQKDGYNLAHYLLGFKHEGRAEIEDPRRTGTQFTCFHLVLELLGYGLGQPSSPVLVVEHPSLGEKCYQLVDVLVSINSAVGTAVVDYLRSHEDWFRRQFGKAAVGLLDPADDVLTRHDLRQKGWLLRSTAMDVHLAVVRHQRSYLESVLQVVVEEEEASGEPRFVAFLQAAEAAIDKPALPFFIQAWCRLVQTVILRADKGELAGAVHGWMVHFWRKPGLAIEVQEALAALALGLSRHEPKEEAQLGEYLECLQRAVLRPDSTIVSRGYLYAAFIRSSAPSAAIVDAVRPAVGRLIEVASRDAVNPAAADQDSWKTLAASFISMLVAAFDAEQLAHLPIDALTSHGCPKSFFASIKSTGQSLLSTLQPSCQLGQDNSENIFCFWEALFVLMERLYLTGSSEIGGIDGIEGVLNNLKIIDWQVPDPLVLSIPSSMVPALQRRFERAVEPILRLALQTSVNAVSAHHEALFRMARLTGQLGEGHLVKLVCRLFNQFAPNVQPLALRQIFANIVVKCLSRLESSALADSVPGTAHELLAESLVFMRRSVLHGRPDLICFDSSSTEQIAKAGKLPSGVFARLMTALINNDLRMGVDEFYRDGSSPPLPRLLFILEHLFFLLWIHLDGRDVGTGDTLRPLLLPIESFAALPVTPAMYGDNCPMRPITMQGWIRKLQHLMSNYGKLI